MKKIKMTIRLDSDSLIASGEGLGATIDSDILFDDIGIPYIPAKRIKGCLRDSITELNKILNQSEIKYDVDIDKVFGNNRKEVTASVSFSNFHIEDYKNTYEWLKYYKNEFSDYISSNLITSFFTDIRQQTAIDKDGVSKDHSLRTSRVIRKGFLDESKLEYKNFVFESEITIFEEDDSIIKTLALSCINLRHIGTNRSRGFGEVTCELFDLNNQSINKQIIKGLEISCK